MSLQIKIWLHIIYIQNYFRIKQCIIASTTNGVFFHTKLLKFRNLHVYLYNSLSFTSHSLYLNISNQQLNRLWLVLHSAARAVTKTPKFHHITPHLKSLHWLKITQNYATQYKILSLTYKYNSTTHLPPILIFSPYNQLVLPTHLQLSLSNALQTPLGSKFYDRYLSTFKLLHFGMLYHIIFALILILRYLFLFSHYLLLNSTSSRKLTFFFIPILLSLASLYWTDPLKLWSGPFVIHYSFHILHPRSIHLNSF